MKTVTDALHEKYKKNFFINSTRLGESCIIVAPSLISTSGFFIEMIDGRITLRKVGGANNLLSFDIEDPNSIKKIRNRIKKSIIINNTVAILVIITGFCTLVMNLSILIHDWVR